MAEFIAEDRQRADAAYEAARVFAMAEYDAVIGEFQRLEKQVRLLRAVINNLSTLTGQPIADKYAYPMFPHKPIQHGKPR